MKLNRHAAPHIRYHEDNRTLMSDVILLLLVLCVLAYLYYGLRAVLLCAFSALAASLSDGICTLLRARQPNLRDLSPIVTGLIIALAMPASVPYYVAVTASVFAIAVVKHPFGGTGHNLFNPAAAGFAFVSICWPSQVFHYPQPFTPLPLFGEVSAVLVRNPMFVLRSGGLPSNNLTELLLGNYPGPMGATNTLVVVACLLYLLYRRTVRWQLPLPFLASCAACALLFPRVLHVGLRSVLYELLSGLLLYGAVFMISDPVTSPKRDSSMVIYGVLTGIVTMVFRYFGELESTLPFALLLSNALVPIIDRYNEALHRMIRRKKLEARTAQKAQKA
ncbi:MAG: RnfABCDGE type electron transport complex subunit D [Anaerotruncus sp.]|jgi:electron transport complex protein RnfD|nr:RnfABCDGE type electron transport complex subunit D [Anaerotruncus sp.]